MKYFVVLSLVFLCVFWVYFAGVKKPESSLEISKMQNVESAENIANATNLNTKEDKNEKSYLKKIEEKVQLKQVLMSPEEIEQLKLTDFHAYLRHEDRVIKQEDKQFMDSIMNPEDRKKIAKERLAVKLIEKLNSNK